MTKNLLVPIIRALLLDCHGRVKLTELYALAKESLDELIQTTPDQHFLLNTFSENFLLMNAIYQIQQQDYDAGFYLLFDGLYIHYQSIEKCEAFGMELSQPKDVMADYYLDWSNYDAVDLSELQSMMQRFWSRLSDSDQLTQAFQTLEIDDANQQEVSLKLIKNQFKKLSLIHHPDKGGNQAQFVAVQRAYQTAMGFYS
jgi:hypothetical protein